MFQTADDMVAFGSAFYRILPVEEGRTISEYQFYQFYRYLLTLGFCQFLPEHPEKSLAILLFGGRDGQSLVHVIMKEFHTGQFLLVIRTVKRFRAEQQCPSLTLEGCAVIGHTSYLGRRNAYDASDGVVVCSRPVTEPLRIIVQKEQSVHTP